MAKIRKGRKMMKQREHGYRNSLMENDSAYVPFSVIGVFILLFAIFSSFSLMKMDHDIAETIYRTDGICMEKAAEDIAAADLARCLNYAGMQALKWRGENPVIRSKDALYEKRSHDGFSVIPLVCDAEPGDVIELEVNLPYNALGSIYGTFANSSRTLIVQGSNGEVYATVEYDKTHIFWRKVKYIERIRIPANATGAHAYFLLKCGDDIKASNWINVGTDPIKDITAYHFNGLLRSNYQRNLHTFNNYAIDIAPNVSPSQIHIGRVNGSIQRELESAPKDDYTIYYILTIKDLNYTLVDLSTGKTQNRSMDVTSLVNSREPLLARLTTEYEEALGSGTTSNIVLGIMNLRTLTYGPWQHYLNGPLNIVTNPSLASTVNAGTLYTQKRVFDSIDPWAAAYTTYYNGKVLYSDVTGRSSDYEEEKQKNISTSYDDLASTGSFSIDIDKGIRGSMEDAGVSMEEVENSARLTVSVSNYTDDVYHGWIYNDKEWSIGHPDLLHNVTHEVYSATIQGEIIRDGFHQSAARSLIVDKPWHSSASCGHGISWKSVHPVVLSHSCALTPDHTWSGNIELVHRLEPSYMGSLTGANLRLLSSNVTCTGIDSIYTYRGNDVTTGNERVDGYLKYEDHSFDWDITYRMNFRIETVWNIDYSYRYSYSYYDEASNTTRTKTKSESDSIIGHTIIDTMTSSHTQRETENMSIIYHPCYPIGGYDGQRRIYSSDSIHDLRCAKVIVDGVERIDACCSDAADRYREQYIAKDLASLQAQYWRYGNGSRLPAKKVYCEVPEWLHKTMVQEMKGMFTSINNEGPVREVALLGENTGCSPSVLIQKALDSIVADMGEAKKRESFVKEGQHHNGTVYSSCSDAARAIARSEAYDHLLHYMSERNRMDSSSFAGYVEAAFVERQKTPLSGLLGGDIGMLFNDQAIQMASSALAREMGVINTMTIIGEPSSKYNWTENMTLLIDQYPDYLYHDKDFDLQEQYAWRNDTELLICPLGVRNVCVFSAGIGDDIVSMLADSTEPLKGHVSCSLSKGISDMNTEVNGLLEDIAAKNTQFIMQGYSVDVRAIEQNQSRLMGAYSNSIREELPDAFAIELEKDAVLRTLVTGHEVSTITKAYLASLSDEEIVGMLANDTLHEKVFSEIGTLVSSRLPSGTEYDDVLLCRLEADLRIGLATGSSEAIIANQAVIDECFSNINAELQQMLDSADSKLTGAMAEQMERRLQRAMRHVPCGLPLIPPKWVCTMNIWEYEVVGKYKVLRVVDNDNECLFHPFYGHVPQTYVREEKDIMHPLNGHDATFPTKIGENLPIYFSFKGYAVTLVGPGPKGVGDKQGDRDERSMSYDGLVKEYNDVKG